MKRILANLLIWSLAIFGSLAIWALLVATLFATSWTATAYCSGLTTKSGVRVHRGIIASDPRVLPLGSIVRITKSGEWDGLYISLDTGGKIKGPIIDIYVPDCLEAKRLGRRSVSIEILRKGWFND